MVVVELDGEDYYGADGGYGVGDDNGDVAEQDSLNHEEDRAKTKHQKCRHGNAIGVTRADSGYRLRQITEDHA